MRKDFFIVMKKVKNHPWKVGQFLSGYALSNGYVLGGFNIGNNVKRELIALGNIRRVSKKELVETLIGRNVL